MSLQYHVTERVVRADPQPLLCRQCSRQMLLAGGGHEASAYVCTCGHRETTDVGRRRGERKLQPSIQDAMLAAVPRLRAFAMSLSGKADRADDLVQETLLRAIANINSFEPGTNMSGWLFTILRNLFRSEYRKRRREVEDATGSYTDSLKSPPEQHGRLKFREIFGALAKLRVEEREAILLVGASGFSYQETAAICKTAVGTIKSRVNRARRKLAELLVIDAAGKLAPKCKAIAFKTADGHGRLSTRILT
jgi:RNA polymerase sigma-70 factor, ECF subfamily